MKRLRHYYRFMRFVIKAGLIWNVRDWNDADWLAHIKASPLKYEFEKLDRESIEVTGKSIFSE